MEARLLSKVVVDAMTVTLTENRPTFVQGSKRAIAMLRQPRLVSGLLTIRSEPSAPSAVVNCS
jgi:hypothetical protein